METQHALILAWMLVGMTNIVILQWMIKKQPDTMIHHYNKGNLYYSALIMIWFVFAFVIIPIYLFKFLAKILPTLEYKVNKKIEELKKNIRR